MGEDGREEEKRKYEREDRREEEKGECERKFGRRWDGEGKRGV